MEKLKIMTILGTRPEIIRLSQVMKACDKYFRHIVVHTGQNYDYRLNQIFFKELGLHEPDYYLDCVGRDLGETIGSIIAKSYKLMCTLEPDAVLVLGDTNSALAVISAKRLKIPIFHMEAGNRCWDWNVPEMINRKIVDHVADINLPYTENARRHLLSEGLDGKNIFVTGSPMREVLIAYGEDIEASLILERLNLKQGQYIVLSAHREENIDCEENFQSLMEAVNIIARDYQKPVIYSVHPRSRKKIEERQFHFHPLVRMMEPFGFLDYNKLQKHALCVISDSGTLSEESAILGFPGVLIRTSTERPEVLEKGTIIIGGITRGEITQALEMVVSIRKNNKEIAAISRLPVDYLDCNVSDKVIKIIQSYTDIVNRVVWRK